MPRVRHLVSTAFFVLHATVGPVEAQRSGLASGDTAVRLRTRVLAPSAAFPLITGIDAVPVVGGSALSVAPRVVVRGTELVIGGPLGAPDALRPALARGKGVLFDPPLMQNGGVPWEPWLWTEWLAPYRGAALILVASLDWVPEHWRERLRTPDATARADADAFKLVLLSRAAAALLRDAESAVGMRGRWDVAADYNASDRRR